MGNNCCSAKVPAKEGRATPQPPQNFKPTSNAKVKANDATVKATVKADDATVKANV